MKQKHKVGASLLIAFAISGPWTAAQSDFLGPFSNVVDAAAVSSDTVVVGIRGSQGAATVYAKSGGGWVQQFLPAPSDPNGTSQYGAAVAVEGDTAVVGAPERWNYQTGEVYVYTRSGTTWSEQQRLAPAGERGYFGFSVSLSGDTLAVGRPYSNDAFVYVFDGTTWNLEAQLTGTDGGTPATGRFGWDVAVDGDTVIVGEYDANAGHVFVRDGTTWTQEARLHVTAGASVSVALSGDTAAVAHYPSNACSIFTRSGTIWSHEATLTGNDTVAGDNFGASVALDGDTFYATATSHRVNGLGAAGAGYLFVRSGTAWTQHTKIVSNTPAANRFFGVSCDLEGNRVVTGDTAAAYVTDLALVVDTDGDGLSDDDEIGIYGTDPNDADTDDDNYDDGDEVDHLPLPTDPLNPDSDGDSLRDGDEVANGTDPMVFDDITPPTAEAGGDQIVSAGDLVQLDGSGSYDDTSGTDDLTFLWSLTSIPAGSSASLSGSTTQTPSFTADLPGVYIVDLVVTDEATLVSVPDSVTISSVNVAPTADAGDDVTVILDQTAVLDGLGSSDPDGDPIAYAWTLIGAPTGSMAMLIGETSATPMLTPDVAGEYTVELVVNDGLEDSIAAEVVVSAITAGDFAQDQVRETMDFVRSLPKSAFDRRGHKRALLRILRHVLRDLNQGKTFHAALKLQWWVLPRVDGVTLRGTSDPKGRWWQWWRTQRADWIVDEVAQVQIYDDLKAAVDALSQ